MIILPQNYEQLYPCINSCGATAKIYSNGDKVYKIYRRVNNFKYCEEKFKQMLNLYHPNVFLPTDIVSSENSSNIYIGYEMDMDNGKALSNLKDADFNKLITSSVDIPEILLWVSSNYFLISDPNVDNVTFDNCYSFVDTYDFSWLPGKSVDKIYQLNLKRINETILCGLLGFEYEKCAIAYLNQISFSLFNQFLRLDHSKSNFIYECLSIVQEATQEEGLKKVRNKILNYSK